MKLLDLAFLCIHKYLHQIGKPRLKIMLFRSEILCHASSPPSLLLLRPLLRLVPVPLRFPLRPPRRVIRCMAVGVLWAHDTIRVACPPDHAIAGRALGTVDLVPALGPQTCVTLAWSMEPGEQVLGSGPEGAEEFEAGKAVHRYLQVMRGSACAVRAAIRTGPK